MFDSSSTSAHSNNAMTEESCTTRKRRLFNALQNFSPQMHHQTPADAVVVDDVVCRLVQTKSEIKLKSLLSTRCCRGDSCGLSSSAATSAKQLSATSNGTSSTTYSRNSSATTIAQQHLKQHNNHSSSIDNQTSQRKTLSSSLRIKHTQSAKSLPNFAESQQQNNNTNKLHSTTDHRRQSSCKKLLTTAQQQHQLAAGNKQLERRNTASLTTSFTRRTTTTASSLTLAAFGTCWLLVCCAWIALCATLEVARAQYTPNWTNPTVQQEIFLLNLEDGYFGCQVNASQDFLQLFELSQLCDGQPHCYLGTDEMIPELKCRVRDKCNSYTDARGNFHTVDCVNGACLDGLCYCNDGFGGKSCDIADENECKYRPCDVFAHCTNTMGSYYCSCFPGYDGDGLRCQDINECEIPSLSALCADNSECCNLPGHFVCKCKPGYQQIGHSQSLLNGTPTGNTSVSCTDIDECQDANACGKRAACENVPGSFRCSCPPGFTGDPKVECFDMDECRNKPCGDAAECTNMPGGFKCACAQGFVEQPTTTTMMNGNVSASSTSQLDATMLQQQQQQPINCVDVNECETLKNACGANAECVNAPGNFFCQCLPNFVGNPKLGCSDVDECAASADACGPNAVCTNTPGSFECACKPGFAGAANSQQGCQDIDECAAAQSPCKPDELCTNTLGSFECVCTPGFALDAMARCADIDECAASRPCGAGALCQNTRGSYKCVCPDKFVARGAAPELGCERAAVDIDCVADSDCSANALCLNATCQCKSGYHISGIECIDVDECALSSPTSMKLDSVHQIGVAVRNTTVCGQFATCTNTDGSFECACARGYEKIDASEPTSKCRDVNECASSSSSSPQACGANSLCSNTEGSYKCACIDGFVPVDGFDPTSGCKSACDGVRCGQHAACKHQGADEVACVCKPGFTFDPSNIKAGCVDINECDAAHLGSSGLCGANAVCTNTPGSFKCHCPPGYSGDASKYCDDINECDRRFGIFGQCGELAICTNTPGSFLCECAPGFVGNPRERCDDIDECAQRTSRCGKRALCSNTPGNYTCACPDGFSGDPHVACEPDAPACARNDDCARLSPNLRCKSGRCVCPTANNAVDSPLHVLSEARLAECRHPCASTECGPHATCSLDADDQPLCVCLDGFMAPGDGSSGCVDINECIAGLSLTGITPIGPNAAMAVATSSVASGNSTYPCGRSAMCRNSPGKFDCICPPGFAGNPYEACTMIAQQQDTPAPPPATSQQEGRTSACSPAGCPVNTKCVGGACVADNTNSPAPPMINQVIANNGSQLSSHSQLMLMPATTPASTAAFGSTGRTSSSSPSSSSSPVISQQQQNNNNNNQQLPYGMKFPSTQPPPPPPPLATFTAATTPKFDNNTQQQQRRQPPQTASASPTADDSIRTADNELDDRQQSNAWQSAEPLVNCTVDWQCAGNLQCLPKTQLNDNNIPINGNIQQQKVCGCQRGFQQAASYCFKQRVNCTSATHCKAREDCVIAADRGMSAAQVQHQQHQQFSMSDSSQTFALYSDTPTSSSNRQQQQFEEQLGICVCPRGYRVTGSRQACVDVNECSEVSSLCAPGAQCLNKPGSYECVCPSGTIGQPYTKSCEPIVVPLSPPQSAINETKPGSDASRNSNSNSQQQQLKQATAAQTQSSKQQQQQTTTTSMMSNSRSSTPPPLTPQATQKHINVQQHSTPGMSSMMDAGVSTSTPSSPYQSHHTTHEAAQHSSLVSTAATSSSLAANNWSSSSSPSSSSATTLAPFDSTTAELIEFRTIPPSELFVMCLADGIQVELQLGGFDGIIYVKGHSQDPKCRKLVSSSSASEFVDFKVMFGHCDLMHRDGDASFVLVIQKHPKLVTYRARAYHVKCLYNTGERTVTLGFNVSMITTSGTIANTGPPPTSLMSITALDGREVTSAEIGQDLFLRVDVQPDSIYGGFARSCEAKTMDDEGEYQYEVTDANGCATDPSIFSDWKHDEARKSLVARFNAFKFPSSNNLRFQCNIRVCFGNCQPASCNGIDVHGKRRRRSVSTNETAIADDDSTTAAATNADATIISEPFKEGSLRDELMVQSNAILTFDKREPRAGQLSSPTRKQFDERFLRKQQQPSTASLASVASSDANNSLGSAAVVDEDNYLVGDADPIMMSGGGRSMGDAQSLDVQSSLDAQLGSQEAATTTSDGRESALCFPQLSAAISALLALVGAVLVVTAATGCWLAGASRRRKMSTGAHLQRRFLSSPMSSHSSATSASCASSHSSRHYPSRGQPSASSRPLPHPSEFPNPMLHNSSQRNALFANNAAAAQSSIPKTMRNLYFE